MARLVAKGVSAADFWEMSWAEVMLVSKEIIRRENEETRMQALLAYKTAELVTHGVSVLFGSKGRMMPSPRQAFPGIFDTVEHQISWQEVRDRFREAFPKPMKKG